jgi:hypothetical protein
VGSIQGVRLRPTSPRTTAFLYELVTEDVLRDLEPRLATMTDADVMALYQAEIDKCAKVPPDSRDQQVPT